MWPFIYVTFCRLFFGRLLGFLLGLLLDFFFGLLVTLLFGLLLGFLGLPLSLLHSLLHLLPTGEWRKHFLLLMNFLQPSQSVARSRGRLIIQPSCQPQTEKKQALPHAQYSADFNVYRNQCA
jgi:hypothetical protein